MNAPSASFATSQFDAGPTAAGRMPPRLMPVLRTAGALAAAVVLYGCGSSPVVPSGERNVQTFQQAETTEKVEYVDKQALAAFDASTEPVYRLGECDRITVNVWGRPEVSGKHVVGPDGRIGLPLAGAVSVALATPEEAGSIVRKALLDYFTAPHVTVGIDEFVGNRVVILGRVQNPGILRFDGPPTLLEALARGGALPVLDKKATLTRCAVFRGRDQIIWVDLRRLLNLGDTAYNIRLRPNDLIYIPDSDDTLVYVMGAVHKPGAYRLTPDMSLLDALAQAGGPNDDAAPAEIAIYRPGKKAILKAPLSSLMTADRTVNAKLEEGDVVFVPKSGLAEVGYFFRQIAPGLAALTLAAALAN